MGTVEEMSLEQYIKVLKEMVSSTDAESIINKVETNDGYKLTIKIERVRK